MRLQCNDGGLEDVAVAIAVDREDDANLPHWRGAGEGGAQASTESEERKTRPDDFSIALAAGDILPAANRGNGLNDSKRQSHQRGMERCEFPDILVVKRQHV